MDGSVVGVGYDAINGIDAWESIIGITTGDERTIGIKSNGNIVSNIDERSKDFFGFDKWKDVVEISYDFGHAFGIQSNGKVVRSGPDGSIFKDYFSGKIEKWKDIVSVSTSDYHVLALDFNGMVYSAGKNDSGQCDISTWTNIRIPDKYQDQIKIKRVFADLEIVKTVQQKLNETGYECGSPDGIAGKNTATAIIQYQSDHNLAETGTVNAELLDAMGIEH